MPSWLYLRKSGGKQMEYVKDEMVFEREFPIGCFYQIPGRCICILMTF